MFAVMGRDIGSSEVKEVFRSDYWTLAMQQLELMVGKYADALGTIVQWDRHDHAYVVTDVERCGGVGVELYLQPDDDQWWFPG